MPAPFSFFSFGMSSKDTRQIGKGGSQPRGLTVSVRPRDRKPRSVRAVLAITLALASIAIAARISRRAPAPPARPTYVEVSEAPPARALPRTEEEAALVELMKLGKPTIDLLVWSRDPQSTESDAVLVLPPLSPGREVVVRPGPGCELASVNGTAVDPATTRLAAPPLRTGLNWLRVRTTLPRKVLGSVDVPADPPVGSVAKGDATEDEVDFYERLRNVLYPAHAAGGANEAAARAGLAALPDASGGLAKEFGGAWIELAVALFRQGHGTPMAALGTGAGASVWEDPAVLAASRQFMDRLQTLLEKHPRKWYLWLGLAWQLRWGEAWDQARAGFVHAAALDPGSGWTWFEIARWERKLESEGGHRRDPRTRVALARAALKHYRLARKHLTGHTVEGVDAVLLHIDEAIKLMEKLVRKADREH